MTMIVSAVAERAGEVRHSAAKREEIMTVRNPVQLPPNPVQPLVTDVVFEAISPQDPFWPTDPYVPGDTFIPVDPYWPTDPFHYDGVIAPTAPYYSGVTIALAAQAGHSNDIF
jgi:hypothetical protein